MSLQKQTNKQKTTVRQKSVCMCLGPVMQGLGFYSPPLFVMTLFGKAINIISLWTQSGLPGLSRVDQFCLKKQTNKKNRNKTHTKAS